MTIKACLKIRAATAGDVEHLVALINAAFLVERFFIDGDRTNVDDVGRLLASGTFLVQDGADGLEAAIYAEARGERAYLGLLAVAPDRQGQGVGRQMLDAAEAWCAARGCRAIDIRVVSIRPELFPIYMGRGYVRRGTSPFPAEHSPKLPCHFIDMSKDL